MCLDAGNFYEDKDNIIMQGVTSYQGMKISYFKIMTNKHTKMSQKMNDKKEKIRERSEKKGNERESKK